MNYTQLPEGYAHLGTMDLSENKKVFWTVNGWSVVVGVLMVVIGWLICPLNGELSGMDIMSLIPFAVAVVGYGIYLVLHEAVHGIFMFAYSKKRVKFGFKKIYAYAGSSAYFDKKSYIIIGLAPVVVWGIVLGVLNIFFPSGMWFWVIWFIQIGNIGGATGDIYVTYRMIKMPKDVLVQDSGVKMELFSRTAAPSNGTGSSAVEDATARKEVQFNAKEASAEPTEPVEDKERVQVQAEELAVAEDATEGGSAAYESATIEAERAHPMERTEEQTEEQSKEETDD